MFSTEPRRVGLELLLGNTEEGISDPIWKCLVSTILPMDLNDELRIDIPRVVRPCMFHLINLDPIFYCVNIV